MQNATAWQKSSYSAGGETSCVELATAQAAPGALLIRESDDPDVILSAAPGAVRALLISVSSGRFNDR